MREFDSLYPPEDLWDRAVARSKSDAALVSLDRSRRPRVSILAAAVLVLAAAAAYFGTRGDDRAEVATNPTTTTGAVSTVVSGAGSCAITSAPQGVAFTPDPADGVYKATLPSGMTATLYIPGLQYSDFVGEQYETVTLGDGREAFVWYAGRTVDTPGSVRLKTGDANGGPCSNFELLVTGPDEGANTSAALTAAAHLTTGPVPEGAPKGDLACPLPRSRPELFIQSPGHAVGQLDGLQVNISVPAGTYAGDTAETALVAGRPATILTAGPDVIIRMSLGVGSCTSVEVTVFQGDPTAERALAEQLVTEIVSQVPAATPGGSRNCAERRIATIVDGAVVLPVDSSWTIDGATVQVAVQDLGASGTPLPGSVAQTTVGDCVAVVSGPEDDSVSQAAIDLAAANAFLVDDKGRVLLGESGALWPETDDGGVPTDPARLDGAAVAGAFATQVLGWSGPYLHVDLVSAATERDTYLVHRADTGGRVLVDVAPAYGGRWWSVVGLRNDGEHDDLGVSVLGTRAFASCEAVDPFELRVRFDYGGRVAEGPGGGPIELGFVPDTRGSVMGFYVSADGAVVGACGATLPAGDFAAG